MSEKEKFTPEGEHSLLRPNRRTDLRLDLLVLEVKGVSESGVFFGYAKNLSGTGMFVATVNPRAVGENFTVSFTLPFEPFVAVSSLCRVAWTREFDPEKGGSPGMGLKFLDMDYKAKSAIERWIAGEDG